MTGAGPAFGVLPFDDLPFEVLAVDDLLVDTFFAVDREMR